MAQVKVIRKAYTRKDGTKVKATSYYTEDKTMPKTAGTKDAALEEEAVSVRAAFRERRRKSEVQIVVRLNKVCALSKRLNLINHN